jgi:hypothetical protein
MPDKTTEYEVTLTTTIYADSQGDAISELERRIKSVPAREDRYAVVLRAVTAKRVGAVRG